MKPQRRTRVSLVMVGFAMAWLGLADAGAATLPKDPCALLKVAEIQALAPNAKIGSGVADASAAPLGASCTYTWGPRTSEWGDPAVTITVIDAATAWVGVSPDTLAEGLRAKIKTGGPNAFEIPGVGDAAGFTFAAHSSNATAEALLGAKGVHLSVTVHSGDSLANKDKVVTLLKEAAARL